MKNWPWAILAPAFIFVLIGIFSPWLMTHDPAAQDYAALSEELKRKEFF